MDARAVRLEKMVREAFALRKRGLMQRVDGSIVKIAKSEERRPMSKRVSFANIIAPVEKSARAHTHAVMVDESIHSTHPSKRSALATAQDILDEDGAKSVSVRALKDEAEAEQYALRKGGRVKDEDEDDDSDEDDAKRKQLRQFAKDLDEDEDDDEDEKKRKLKAYARKLGIFLKDEDDDSDDDSADDADDEMDDDTKRSRGIHGNGAKRRASKSAGLFTDLLLGGSRRKVLDYPLDDDTVETMSSPRIADEGADQFNRAYANDVLERLGGGLRDSSGTAYDDSAIPIAGSGLTWTGDTRDISWEPQRPRRFMREDEGEVGRVGGEDRGVAPARPNQGRSGPYTMEREDITPEGGAMVPTSLPGGMRVMNPGASGISGPAAFRPMQNDGLSTVLKSRRRPGLFKNVILAPDPHGCTPPGPKGE